ncbi:MAG: hypothetical protein ACI8YQ_004534 [Polaribacter sp.]|jgi:hypothetical protein
MNILIVRRVADAFTKYEYIKPKKGLKHLSLST